ncbi:TRAP transporter permease [Natronomonas marina]|uniref:TRAP transporter permease n=1 Tax=Natronomonas marina TaxID=2961939 RepID=UPI0020CA14EF|nr:TRAP transporter fused permease subunit [Natronomonas marina]
MTESGTEDVDEEQRTSLDLNVASYKPGAGSVPLDATSIASLEGSLPRLTRANAGVVLVFALGIALSLYSVVFAYDRPYTRSQYTVLFLGLSLVLFFTKDALESKEYRNRYTRFVSVATAVGFVLAAGGASIYFFYTFESLATRILDYYWYEYVLSAIIVLAVLEGTRRAYGLLLSAVAYLAIIYAYAGYLVPGRWGHPGYDTGRILEVTVLGLESIYGSLPTIGATWVAIFIIFAGLVQAYGGMELIRDIALYVGNRFTSGIAQIAVITSMLMGTITGSAAANTAATGSFTIPLMKRYNVDSEEAAAIESVASSGGQMLPPVMGTAAFLMAEIIGVPFADIVIWGLLPALLFYMTVSITVSIVTVRNGIEAPAVDISGGKALEVLRHGLNILLALAVLVYVLVILRYDPMTAGMYAILTLVGSTYVIAVVNAIRSTDEELSAATALVTTTKQTLNGLYIGAKSTAPIMIVLGPIAIVVSLVTLTAINQAISMLMVSYGSTLPLLLVLGALMSILFGLGMPTVAAYILVSIFVVPSLIRFGVPDVYGHFFVFYFAIISGITPPIAIVIAVASGIANADFVRTCVKAIPLALPGFIVPFVFVYNPSIIDWGATTPIVFLSMLVGTVLLVIAVLGYLFDNDYSAVTRILMAGVAVTILFAPWLLLQATLAAVALSFILYNTPTVYGAARTFVSPR